ncbi:hypothetical protein ACWDSB_35685, partial [Streptomyces sp. NPDC003514]
LRSATARDLDAVLAFWKSAAEGTSISDDRDGAAVAALLTLAANREPGALNPGVVPLVAPALPLWPAAAVLIGLLPAFVSPAPRKPAPGKPTPKEPAPAEPAPRKPAPRGAAAREESS